MKLYKIEVLHGAPKSSWTNIYAYILAENDMDVYEYLRPIAFWEDYEEDNKTYEIYDDDFNLVGTENFKEKMLRLKGDANDEDIPWEDAYYGITAYGWVDMGDITDNQISVLKELNIIENQETTRQ